MSNIPVVERFVESWNRMDVGAIASAFATDGVWHNIPMEPRRGREAIRVAVARFLANVDTVDWRTLAIAEDADGRVLTERVDGFGMKNGARVELPVMGIFEIAGGQIVSWRDYFDLAMMQNQMAAAG